MMNIAQENTVVTRRQSVSTIQPTTEIAVFYPTSALMLDLADWFGGHSRFAMRMVQSRQVNNIQGVFQRAAVAIIDATEALNAAITAMGICLEYLPPENIVVYTKCMHEGLELFVRTRGVLLVLGPISRIEWEALLRPLNRRISTAV
jgi:uncharacterized membrane protein YecN with MAPEG domain